MFLELLEAAILVGIYVYNRYFGPRPPKPKPLTKDNLNLPRIEEGATVPIVFGRCRVKSPILTWTGDLQSKIVDNSNNGAAYIVYALDMLFVVGLPMGAGVAHGSSLTGPKLHNAWLGDKLLPAPVAGWLPGAANGLYYSQMVYQPNLFGGPGAGGGLKGAYQFFGGWTDQDLVGSRTVGIGPSRIGDILTSYQALGAAVVPGYRKKMLVAFTKAPADSSDPYWFQTGLDGGGGTTQAAPYPDNGFVLGESPNVDGLSFEISCYGDQLFAMTTPGLDFAGDADPVEVIYDILTNKWSRVGLDPAKIDTASFLACSTTLKAENHGYSDVLYSSTQGAAAVAEILRQIDAVLYEEPTTGLLTLKLIRADYDPAAIPVFTVDNIVSVDDFGLGSFRDTVNEVRVTYTDRKKGYETVVAIAQSLANAVGNSNRRRVKEIPYPGVTNAILAGQLAARDLNILSQPIAKISLTVNRDGHRLRPGQVFKVVYPEYAPLASGMIFRAGKMDQGQLFDNKIKIDALQDAFATQYQGIGSPWFGIFSPTPYPIVTRTVVEAPRWLCGAAADSGLITDPELTHVLPLAVPNTNDAQYLVKTRVLSSSKLTGQLFYNWLVDVPQQDFAGSFQIVNDVARETEPYDTVTGITIQNVTGDALAYIAQYLTVLFVNTYIGISSSHDDIALRGQAMIVLVRSDGRHEFMAFESTTDLGGGQYRLNKVWRALMDTPAIKHTAGATGFFVHPTMIGRRGWNTNRSIHLVMVPRSQQVVGSGADPEDVYSASYVDFVLQFSLGGQVQTRRAQQITSRSSLPLPMANFAIGGEDCQAGTQGVPAVAGQYKAIPLLEGAVDYFGTARERLSPQIKRGDEVADTVISTVTYAARAFPAGVSSPTVDKTLSLYQPVAGAAGSAGVFGLVTVNGYGSVDLAIESDDKIGATDPRSGKGGIYPGMLLYNMALPRVTAFAPSWRNLAYNSRWNRNASGEALGWNVETGTGTTSILQGTFSLRRLATGDGSWYMGATSGSTSPWKRAVRHPVSAWNPRGLTAVMVGYIKNDNADANDTGLLTLEAHDSAGGPPDTTLATASSAATIGPTAGPWARQSVSLALPASTASIVGWVVANEVATGGTAGPDTRFTDVEIRVGEWGTTNGLANYSFESGSTSWTVDSGTITTGSSNLINGPSPAYVVVGNSVATAQIHQDYTIPDGYQWGTAVLTSWVEQTNVNCTREVKIQALDGSVAVLATATTGAGAPGLNWAKDTVYLQLPDGAAKIRVILIGATDGSNIPTVRFDDVVLWLAKDLAPAMVHTYDFSAPTIEKTPASWQDHALKYPALPVPHWIFGGTDFNNQEVSYTDGVGRPAQTISGQFGSGVSEISAYPFVRGSGAGAPHAAATGLGRSGIANYKLTDAFSVVVKFRVDEPGFASGCGLVGRCNLGNGWGISINASGQLGAFLRGASSTNKSVQLARNCADGAYRMAALVNDPVAQLLWIYDEVGGASVSTAAGLGAIDGAALAQHLRIGRCSDDFDVVPGAIARVMIYDAALTGPQIASLWNYAADPTGKVTTYTRSTAAYAIGGYGASGRTAYFVSAAQVAIPYYEKLGLDTAASGGYGLAVGKSCANLLPTADFTNATSWVKGASATLTQGVAGPTGRYRAVTVVGDASNGLKVVGITLAATPGTVVVVFMARTQSGGTPSLDVKLLDASDVVKGTQTVAISGQWERYAVTISGWTGSTGTGRVQFISHAGALSFDLSSVMHVGQGTDVPALIPLPNSTHGDYSATLTDSADQQFNAEGEIIATGVAMIDVPTTAAGTIAQVSNGANAKNQRELQTLSTGKMRLAHNDGAGSPATVNSDLTYATFSSRLWKIRGRWCRSGTQDNVSPQSFAEVAWTDDTHATATLGGAGRTATWTNDATVSNTIKLGAGTAAPSDLVLRSVVVQAREEKLP